MAHFGLDDGEFGELGVFEGGKGGEVGWFGVYGGLWVLVNEGYG